MALRVTLRLRHDMLVYAKHLRARRGVRVRERCHIRPFCVGYAFVNVAATISCASAWICCRWSRPRKLSA